MFAKKNNMNFQTFSTVHHCYYTNISGCVFEDPLKVIKYILHIHPYIFFILIFIEPPRVQFCRCIISFSSAFIVFVVSKANI